MKGIEKFEKILKTDEDFQKKLQQQKPAQETILKKMYL